MYETISTDVLIIGGGGAGLRAAIEARDLGASVTMIVKGKFGNSGCTLNVGTSAVVGLNGQNGDTNMSSMCDLVSFGGFLADQKLAKILVDETMERVQELVDWGVDFQREDDGSIALYRSAAHTHVRNFTFKPAAGHREHTYGSPPGIAMMDALMDQAESRGVTVMDDAVLIDLLTNDGRVVGATVLDCRRSDSRRRGQGNDPGDRHLQSHLWTHDRFPVRDGRRPGGSVPGRGRPHGDGGLAVRCHFGRLPTRHEVPQLQQRGVPAKVRHRRSPELRQGAAHLRRLE